MIDIPFDILIGLTQGIGTVYYYSSDQLKHTDEPHYFVVLAHSDSTIHVVCATSQIEKRKEWVRRNRLPHGTLVEVAPTHENGLRKHSLFDCNTLIEETIQSLKAKHSQEQIKVRGKMDTSTVALLKAAVLLSPLVTREKKQLLTPV